MHRKRHNTRRGRDKKRLREMFRKEAVHRAHVALIQSLKPGMLVRLGEEQEPLPDLEPGTWRISPSLSLPAVHEDDFVRLPWPNVALLVKKVSNRGTYRWQAMIDEKLVYLENREITGILKA